VPVERVAEFEVLPDAGIATVVVAALRAVDRWAAPHAGAEPIRHPGAAVFQIIPRIPAAPIGSDFYRSTKCP